MRAEAGPVTEKAVGNTNFSPCRGYCRSMSESSCYVYPERESRYDTECDMSDNSKCIYCMLSRAEEAELLRVRLFGRLTEVN
jgi:hypothetical protein